MLRRALLRRGALRAPGGGGLRALPCARALCSRRGDGDDDDPPGGSETGRINLDRVFGLTGQSQAAVLARGAREAKQAAEARAEVARSSEGGRSSPRWQLIAASQARKQYLLPKSALEGLPFQERRNPYAPDAASMRMYWVHDVERASVARWGSLQGMEDEKEKRAARRAQKRASQAAADGFATPTLLGRLLDLERRRKRVDRRVRRSSDLPAGPSSGTKAVNTAIGANGILFVAKLGAFVWTGSASMLSEALHSLADFCNQILLRVGIEMSTRPSDATHPYGYGTERYVWSLISGVGIFFMGCGVSIYHGVSGLLAGHEIVAIPVALGVLGTSFVLEGYTLVVALREVRAQADEAGLTFREYMMEGPDPMNVAVVAEDSAAVLGVGIATCSLLASTITGNPVYDALGSVAVGGLMGGVAFFLIQRNRDLLVGRSLHPERLETALRALREDSVVASVHDVKAVMMGNVGRFKAELLFNAEVLATKMVERRYGNMGTASAALRAVGTDSELEDLFIRNSADLLAELGREVDRLEDIIRRELPEMQYVDLEIL